MIDRQQNHFLPVSGPLDGNFRSLLLFQGWSLCPFGLAPSNTIGQQWMPSCAACFLSLGAQPLHSQPAKGLMRSAKPSRPPAQAGTKGAQLTDPHPLLLHRALLGSANVHDSQDSEINKWLLFRAIKFSSGLSCSITPVMVDWCKGQCGSPGMSRIMCYIYGLELGDLTFYNTEKPWDQSKTLPQAALFAPSSGARASRLCSTRGKKAVLLAERSLPPLLLQSNVGDIYFTKQCKAAALTVDFRNSI